MFAAYASKGTILQDPAASHVPATALPAIAQLAIIAFLHTLFPVEHALCLAQESAWRSTVLEPPLLATPDAIPAQSETTRSLCATLSRPATLRSKERSSDAILPARPAATLQQPA